MRRLSVAAITFMVASLVFLMAVLHVRAMQDPDATMVSQGAAALPGAASLQDLMATSSLGSCDEPPEALRGLLFPFDGCMVTGISPDGRIVGLDVDDDPSDVRGMVVDGMRERGWVLLGSQGDMVLSFGHEGRWDDERVQSDERFAQVSFAMVVVQPLGGSTSVLVQIA